MRALNKKLMTLACATCLTVGIGAVAYADTVDLGYGLYGNTSPTVKAVEVMRVPTDAKLRNNEQSQIISVANKAAVDAVNASLKLQVPVRVEPMKGDVLDGFSVYQLQGTDKQGHHVGQLVVVDYSKNAIDQVINMNKTILEKVPDAEKAKIKSSISKYVDNMKSLKVLACAACLLGTVSGVGFAKDVQTIAGSMVVPNNVNVVSASKTNTRDFVEKQLNENSSKSSMANMMAKEFLQNLGTNFDVYQLQGSDKTGQKDAFLVAVDVKQIAQKVAKDKANDPMFVAAMAALDKGQIDPVTEQLMLGAINKQIPTTTTVVPLNDPKRYANLKTRSGELLIKPRTLTVENAEQVHPVAGTKYQTYAASSRLLYADGNVQTPLYANAAFVLKPGKPVLYVGVTTDVQRDYFKTIFDNAFKSIK